MLLLIVAFGIVVARVLYGIVVVVVVIIIAAAVVVIDTKYKKWC